MKNLLKITVALTAFVITNNLSAQEPAKAPAKSTTTQQEPVKKTEKAAPQDSKEKKSDDKAAPAPGGGSGSSNKMAITEQGVTKRTKVKSATATPSSTDGTTATPEKKK